MGNGRGGDEGLDDDGRIVRVDFGALLELFTIRIRGETNRYSIHGS